WLRKTPDPSWKETGPESSAERKGPYVNSPILKD
ncbi:MAG: hypothetical protein MRERV_38c001, partial [Mycoplasmataceae bacterium RV_VA103A]